MILNLHRNKMEIKQMKTVIAKFKQPSTWAGFGVAVAVFGPYVETAAHAASWPSAVVAVLSGVIAVIKDETGSK